MSHNTVTTHVSKKIFSKYISYGNCGTDDVWQVFLWGWENMKAQGKILKGRAWENLDVFGQALRQNQVSWDLLLGQFYY